MSNRKLTHDDADTIRDWHQKYLYTQEELADIFGVSRTAIRRVLNGESYLSEEDGNDLTPMARSYEDVPKVIDNDSYNASYGIVLGVVLGACLWVVVYVILRAFL